MYEYSGTVVRVIDGDTVEAMIDLGMGVWKKAKLRINDLDTPEIYRPSCEAEKVHGMEAKAYAQELLMCEGVELVFHTSKNPKIYGRYSATIKIIGMNEMVDFAEKMIAEGYQKRDDYFDAG